MIGLTHPLLEACGVRHAFGVRDAPEPPGLVCPTQVHGTAVATVRGGQPEPAQADAILGRQPGCPVGIVTADCVPVLAGLRDGSAVAAIHAGWRGLAAGVVTAAIAALRESAPVSAEVVAVIGPHIGICCYEVDDPVLVPLRARFGELGAATRPSGADRPGHRLLDLGALVAWDLERAGVSVEARAAVPDACTRCDAVRFHSFRRDGT